MMKHEALISDRPIFRPQLLCVCAALIWFVTGVRANAQVASPTTTVVVRELAPIEVRSTVSLGAIVGVRLLPGGKVLVSDGGNRQVVLLDEKMASRTVIIDSASADGKAYGPVPTPLISYIADTTLFVDRVSATLSVINPSGVVIRIAAPPKPTDIGFLTAFSGGADPGGRLIYRGALPRDPAAPPQPAMVATLQPPDSAPIVRANFETRLVDTLARLKVAGNVRARSETVGSEEVMIVTVNPLITIDDWALLSDGTLAIVRGQDYHVDLLRADGTRFSGPRLPFDWKQLSDADKQRLVDSTQAANEKEKATTPLAMTLPPGGGVQRVRMRPGSGLAIKREVVKRSDIADYWPPIRYGATKADADGNLWILPTTSAQSKAGELVYDVVNNRGEMMYRVRVPSGRQIAGFGRGGMVYVMGRNDDKTWFLERTRLAK